MTDAHDVVDRVFRLESGRAVAGLIRVLGDFDLAEEAVQEAFVAALEHWPREGVPANPGAWITTTARRRAIDRLRRGAGPSGEGAAAAGGAPPRAAGSGEATRLARLRAAPAGHEPGRATFPRSAPGRRRRPARVALAAPWRHLPQNGGRPPPPAGPRRSAPPRAPPPPP